MVSTKRVLTSDLWGTLISVRTSVNNNEFEFLDVYKAILESVFMEWYGAISDEDTRVIRDTFKYFGQNFRIGNNAKRNSMPRVSYYYYNNAREALKNIDLYLQNLKNTETRMDNKRDEINELMRERLGAVEEGGDEDVLVDPSEVAEEVVERNFRDSEGLVDLNYDE